MSIRVLSRTARKQPILIIEVHEGMSRASLCLVRRRTTTYFLPPSSVPMLFDGCDYLADIRAARGAYL